MLIQKQKNLHKPEEGIFGDCFRTCLAVLLGVDAEEVPHFLKTGKFEDQLYIEWLNANDLHLLRVTFPGEYKLEQILITGSVMSGDMPYLLSGFSRSGCNHVVVCQGIEIVCDPSLTDAGIVGPMQNDYADGIKEEWWVEWLVRKL